jgi:hypothetical protein
VSGLSAPRPAARLFRARARNKLRNVIPGLQMKTFVFNLRRKQYETEFGLNYEKPHGFARFLGSSTG